MNSRRTYTQQAARFHSIDRYKETGVNKTATPNKFFIVAGRTIKRSGRFDVCVLRTIDAEQVVGRRCHEFYETCGTFSKNFFGYAFKRFQAITVYTELLSSNLLDLILIDLYPCMHRVYIKMLGSLKNLHSYLIYLLQTSQLEPYQFTLMHTNKFFTVHIKR